MKRYLQVVSVVVVLAFTAVACGGGGGGGETPSTPAQNLQKGGTLQVATVSDVTATMDPQKEYYQEPWALMRCCMLRQLVSYNGEDVEHGGTKLFPDVAESMPEVSSDNLTWTFHLKQGLHYSPPLQDVEITAQDFIRALMREATPDVAAGYGFYYTDIKGWSDFSSGKAKTISGLSAPDKYTLEVTLTHPAGDLGYRLAMPAAAPIPPNPDDPNAPLGVAEGHNDDYGRFMVSSGPYMYQGSENLDFSVPAKQQKPVSGYQVSKNITLVRNPSWSDDDLRPAYVNEIDFSITPGGEQTVIEKKVQDNELDTIFGNGVAPETLRSFQTDPNLKNRIFINPAASNYYISMNLATPPFDDINVRKAVEYAIDKAGYQRLNGGPQATGPVAGHFVPSVDLGNALQDYNPYATPGDQGADNAQGLQMAKDAMKQSKYDTNQDGVCDADACKNVLAIGVTGRVAESISQLFQQNMAKIGIQLNYKFFDNGVAYNKIFDPKNHIPWQDFAGWIHDYPDGYTWFYPILYGPNILDQYNTNYSMVGATSQQLTKYGYSIKSVPSMDSQIEKCFPLTGTERTQCWADADKYFMENIVAAVPLVFSNVVNIISDRVENFTFSAVDQAPAYDHLALANGGA